jgi:hypothetical protein
MLELLAQEFKQSVINILRTSKEKVYNIQESMDEKCKQIDGNSKK